jgi:hypothetical protein
MLAFRMMDYHYREVKMSDRRKLVPFGNFQEIIRIYIGLVSFYTKDIILPVNVSCFAFDETFILYMF